MIGEGLLQDNQQSKLTKYMQRVGKVAPRNNRAVMLNLKSVEVQSLGNTIV
jgi:hypothetical protein